MQIDIKDDKNFNEIKDQIMFDVVGEGINALDLAIAWARHTFYGEDGLTIE